MREDHGFWFLNTRVVFHRASAAAADGLSIMEHWMPPGESPPSHVHEFEDEVFHVLEGVVRFRVGTEERRARAGDTLVAPKGVPHSFVVESAEGARCMVITAGADFEGLIRAASRPAERADLPPAMTPTPEMMAALDEAARAHRIAIVGPPLAA